MKSHFIYRGHDRHEHTKWFSVVFPSIFYDAHLDRTDMCPWGFWTDYASVPRIPLSYMITGNTEHPAAKHHDKDYRWLHRLTRRQSDTKFQRAMVANSETAPKQNLLWKAGRSIRRGAMYTAVRGFGIWSPNNTPGCLNYLTCNREKLKKGCVNCTWYFPAWKHCYVDGYVPDIVQNVEEELKKIGKTPDDYIRNKHC